MQPIPDRRSPIRSVLLLMILAPAAVAQPEPMEHGFHPPMPDEELFVQCRYPDGPQQGSAEVILRLPSPITPTELDQTLRLPPPWPPITVRRYLPKAERAQRVEPGPDPGSPPAVELAITGPAQSYQRWLIAGDTDRNRLTSLIGTWRYVTADTDQQRDELHRQFERERTRPPELIITAEGLITPVRMPARPKESRRIEKPECTVTVRRFFPHFGFEEKTREPVNQSDKRLNPAALVQLQQGDRKEERWVFAKFPGFQMHETESIPVRVALDCPQEAENPAPDFVLCTTGRQRHELWQRNDGQIERRNLEAGQTVPIPDSNYTFAIRQFVPSGVLVETYSSTQSRKAVTAVEVRVEGLDLPVWLALGHARNLTTPAGPLTLTFGSRPKPTGGEKK